MPRSNIRSCAVLAASVAASRSLSLRVISALAHASPRPLPTLQPAGPSGGQGNHGADIHETAEKDQAIRQTDSEQVGPSSCRAFHAHRQDRRHCAAIRPAQSADRDRLPLGPARASSSPRQHPLSERNAPFGQGPDRSLCRTFSAGNAKADRATTARGPKVKPWPSLSLIRQSHWGRHSAQKTTCTAPLRRRPCSPLAI